MHPSPALTGKAINNNWLRLKIFQFLNAQHPACGVEYFKSVPDIANRETDLCFYFIIR